MSTLDQSEWQDPPALDAEETSLPRQNSSSLTDLTTRFGKAYRRLKIWEAEKKVLQRELFKALDQEIEATRRLPRRSITSDAPPKEILLQNPGYRIKESGPPVYTLERDPSLIPATYVNLIDGKVYGRDTPEAGPSLDLDRIQEEDPELWEEISEPTRVVIDPTLWTEEQRDKVDKYMIPGAITTRLRPPREATPEELEEAAAQ